MNTWKVIFATVVIFGAGVVTGALVVRNSEPVQTPARHRNNGPARPTAQFSPGGIRLEFLRRAQRELDLDPTQREQVDKILKESQERSRKIMEPVSADLREELKRTRNEFLQVLTPQQKIHFEEIIKKQQRPREHRPSTPTKIEGAQQR